ncbi:MAG: hypothetical protein JO287_27725 [Pseudonocardiales bacterium]|nr:hypothetical protein [Pseudonocardiales bacterium]
MLDTKYSKIAIGNNAPKITTPSGWNNRCHPFTWTKTADDILAKADRRTTSETLH